MRRRLISSAKEPALKLVKELDAFPKVPETYQQTSAAGGGISILTFIFIAVLLVSECHYYSQTKLKYDYEVDKEFGHKLKINVDITIAMQCHKIGADVVDVTGAGAETFGHLSEEDVYFDLSPLQNHYLKGVQEVNTYIRNSYAAMHEILWKTGYNGMGGMPARETERPEHPPDSCRIHGTLEVNKVAGNFHVTAGKSVRFVNVKNPPHLHMGSMFGDKEYNFSHRIDHFSFGEVTPGIINTLDGEMKVVDSNLHVFNYFIEIVPTLVKTYKANVDTFQYAATEKNRSIDHNRGSHGVPGIFMKYDFASFKVHVRETHEPYTQFLIRLIGIVGGVFATSGLLNSLVQILFDVVCCRYKIGKYQRTNSVVLVDHNERTTPAHLATTSLDAHDPPSPVLLASQLIVEPRGS